MNCINIQNTIESEQLTLENIQKEFQNAIGNDKPSIAGRVKKQQLKIKQLKQDYAQCIKLMSISSPQERETSENNPTDYDIARWRKTEEVEEPHDNFTYYSAEENTNYSRGEILRVACQEALKGDILYLNSGCFDINASKAIALGGKGNLFFPTEVTIKGNGINHTTLYTRKDGDKRGDAYRAGMPFQLTHKVILEDLTLHCESDSVSSYDDGDYNNLLHEEDVMTLGFYPYEGREEKALYARITRCKIISNAWAISIWGNYGDSCDILKCEIISGRQGVSIMGSGSKTGNLSSENSKVNIHKCNFYIDVNNHTISGAVSHELHGGAYGVITRGGHVKVKDCNFYLIGDKGENKEEAKIMPICVGISDSFDTPGASFTKIESINNNFHLQPNKATVSAPIHKKILTI